LAAAAVMHTLKTNKLARRIAVTYSRTKKTNLVDRCGTIGSLA
jgi:hypothetical protein